MAVKFTQYILPHGRSKETSIERPNEIQALADKFTAAGGKYEIEVLTTGHVSMTACFKEDGEWQDVEIQVCENGPEVLERVDSLVRKSAAYLVRHP